jgi:hypothetical protein
MSMIRPLLLSLAALLIVPATAHAADDDVCVGWVHVFIDAEVDGDTLTVTSENACLMHAGSLDELEPFADGKPYRGGFPGLSGAKKCAALEREINDMRRALTEANKRWPDAVAARDAAATEARDALAAYEQARGTWLAAQVLTDAAKAAYADVFEVVVETERDRDGHVVVVRQIGYSGDTVLGRAVLQAMQREDAAWRAMEEAWAKWVGAASSTAQAAQFRVDQYRSIQDLYPSSIEEALAEAAAVGCK